MLPGSAMELSDFSNQFAIKCLLTRLLPWWLDNSCKPVKIVSSTAHLCSSAATPIWWSWISSEAALKSERNWGRGHLLQCCLQIGRLDQDVSWSRALDGNEYMPGLLGLNNMKHNDYVNVAVQILSRVAPVRDLFLEPSNFNDSMSPLTIRFGELLRKMWNPRNFKGQVGPESFHHASISW